MEFQDSIDRRVSVFEMQLDALAPVPIDPEVKEELLKTERERELSFADGITESGIENRKVYTNVSGALGLTMNSLINTLSLEFIGKLWDEYQVSIERINGYPNGIQVIWDSGTEGLEKRLEKVQPAVPLLVERLQAAPKDRIR